MIAAATPILALAVGLSLFAMRDAVVFFYGPSEARAKAPVGRAVRLGGLVQEHSVTHRADGLVTFQITDRRTAVPTAFKGELPDLFREGQGVVAQGEFDASGLFHARQVLAKHDETYMPKEVVEALKRSGEWRGDATPPMKRP